MEYTVNPELAAVEKTGIKTRCEVVFLRGLVDRAEKSSVALRAGLFGASSYEVQLSDVLLSEENADGSVTLMVRSSAPVAIGTTAGVLQVEDRPNRTPEEIAACIQASRDQCIKDHAGLSPAQAAAVCDDVAIASLRQSLCENPPRVSGGLPVPGRLGVEVVSDGFG
jgi:hypothetical protein